MLAQDEKALTIIKRSFIRDLQAAERMRLIVFCGLSVSAAAPSQKSFPRTVCRKPCWPNGRVAPKTQHKALPLCRCTSEREGKDQNATASGHQVKFEELPEFDDDDEDKELITEDVANMILDDLGPDSEDVRMHLLPPDPSSESKVILTRQLGKNAELMERLDELKIPWMELPMIDYALTLEFYQLHDKLVNENYDFVILTSPLAAQTFLLKYFEAGAPDVKIAVVGEGTAKVVRNDGVDVSFVPSKATGATLAQELPFPEALTLPDNEGISEGEVMRRKMEEEDLVRPYNHPAEDIPRQVVEDLAFEMSHNPPEDHLRAAEGENEGLSVEGGGKGDDFDDEWDFELEDSLNLDDESESGEISQNMAENGDEVADEPRGPPRCLYPTSSLASGDVVDILQNRGFEVDRLNVYRTESVGQVRKETAREAIKAKVVALASPSAAQAWFDTVISDFLLPANAVAAACIGETTAKRMRKLGSDRVFYPESPGIDGWVESIVQALKASEDFVPSGPEYRQACKYERWRDEIDQGSVVISDPVPEEVEWMIRRGNWEERQQILAEKAEQDMSKSTEELLKGTYTIEEILSGAQIEDSDNGSSEGEEGEDEDEDEEDEEEADEEDEENDDVIAARLRATEEPLKVGGGVPNFDFDEFEPLQSLKGVEDDQTTVFGEDNDEF